MKIDLDYLASKLTAGLKPNQQVPPLVRAAIAGAFVAGAPPAAISRAFNVNCKTIRRSVGALINPSSSSASASTAATGYVCKFRSEQPRAERPPVLTARERRYIARLARRKPGLTARMLAGTGDGRIEKGTVRMVLREEREERERKRWWERRAERERERMRLFAEGKVDADGVLIGCPKPEPVYGKNPYVGMFGTRPNYERPQGW